MREIGDEAIATLRIRTRLIDRPQRPRGASLGLSLAPSSSSTPCSIAAFTKAVKSG